MFFLLHRSAFVGRFWFRVLPGRASSVGGRRGEALVHSASSVWGRRMEALLQRVVCGGGGWRPCYSE